MRILFIGGTRFVGRAMAEAAIARGHDVTVLHRSPTAAVPEAEHLLADRDRDLTVLHGREFDATVDVCAYVPRQVATVAQALGGRGGHHVFISTMSVYAEDQRPGFGEDGPLVELDDPATEDVTDTTYGGLKVLCERAATAAHGDGGLAIVRPTYVVGPHDPTGRFTWWVSRIAAGGEVLAPGPADAPMQVIDARDQGAWTIGLAERGATGAFNAVAPPMPYTFGDMLGDIAAGVAPAGTTLRWVEGGWLRQQGEDGMSLPLWSEGEKESTMAASQARAVETGLTGRPVAETAADTWAWLRADEVDVSGWHLTREREAELLGRWEVHSA